MKTIVRNIIKILNKLKFRFYGGFYGMAFKKSGRRTRILSPVLITPEYIECGNNVLILKNARIEGIKKYQGQKYNPKIIFKDGVSIQQGIHLTCANKITIGEKVAIASNVTITDINHSYQDIGTAIEEQPLEVNEVFIGRNSKIYNNVVILPGVKLGKHTIVGANSLVKAGTYPDYCVLLGSPAKVVKKYDIQTKHWINL